jgi:glycosyltransferase involved in cell wall biosynthesis
MAKGKPVIATTCGGPESFVNESNGLLIPAEDVEATTKAIDYMVEHLDQYDGEAIRRFCYENFSEDAISKRIISLYEEVINNKGKNGVCK